MREPLEAGAIKVLQGLQQRGYEAFLVGGCVRDRMLGRTVKDYDIATSARPEQVQKTFERTIPTGLQHGTVTVVIDGFTYEVTTFRKEEGYEQYRRPAEVQYIDSLLEDLRRRDFTMNAMALDAEGKLVDPFRGMEDLRQGILRCVGEPHERFEEDALRMLRCIRFAAEYGLQVEPRTWESLCRHAKLLKHIAMERVRMELERMLGGSAPHTALQYLASSRILRYAKVPLILQGLTAEQDWQAIAQLSSVTCRWAYLYLHFSRSAAELEEELKRLTFSNQQIREIAGVAAAAYDLIASMRSEAQAESSEMAQEERIWKLTALKFGPKALKELHYIITIDRRLDLLTQADPGVVDRWAEKGLHWLDELKVTNLSELNLSGKQLLSGLNRKGGPWMSILLQYLLEETALGRLENRTDALLDEAGRWAERELT